MPPTGIYRWSIPLTTPQGNGSDIMEHNREEWKSSKNIPDEVYNMNSPIHRFTQSFPVLRDQTNHIQTPLIAETTYLRCTFKNVIPSIKGKVRKSITADVVSSSLQQLSIPWDNAFLAADEEFIALDSLRMKILYSRLHPKHRVRVQI